MRRRDIGVIMKSCVAALSAAVVLTAMPTQVNAAAKKTMTVTTQKSLNAAMKDKKVTTITIKTNKNVSLSIPTGKYTSKSVVIEAPKASLINKATLKGMTIKSAKIVTEKADNNKIKITDKGLRIIVSKGADNSKISIGTKDAKVTVVADGKVSSVTVNKKALVAVTGKTTKPVSVISNAPETGLILSAKSNVALKETTSVTVKKGADVGKITSYKNAIVDVVKGAKVNLFNSIGNKSSVKIDADGTVNKVALQKKASVTITGDTTKPVEVDNNAAGTVVNLAAKAIVNSSASASVNALRNAIIEYIEATKTLMLNLQGGSTVKEVKAIQDILLNLSKGSEVNNLIGSKNVDIKVAEGATLDSVKLVGKDVKANVNVDGKIENLLIEKKADVKIKGTTQTPVNVTSNAAGAVLGLSTAANLTLNENAKVNVAAGAKVGSLTVAKDVTLNVAPKATVEELVVKGSDAKIDVTANGTLGSLTIDAKADVLIKGITDKPVVVNANVESAKIKTEVKTEVNANANVDITLGAGAEGSKVVAGKDVNASVKNETKENVTVTDSTGKDTTVGSGSTGDTKPAPIIPTIPTMPTVPIKIKPTITIEKGNNATIEEGTMVVQYDGQAIKESEDFIVTVPNGVEIEKYEYKFSGEAYDTFDKEGLPTYAGNYTIKVTTKSNGTYEKSSEIFGIRITGQELTAEVIFGKDSSNLQILFKEGNNYLTTDQINQLPLYNILIAKGFTVKEGNTNLSVAMNSDEKGNIADENLKWTIHSIDVHQNGSGERCGDWSVGATEINSKCREIIPADGYGVYSTSAWDGLVEGGVLTATAPNAGFLKIHLGVNLLQGDAQWSGFSEAYDAENSNVYITIENKNCIFTVKKFGVDDKIVAYAER